MQSLLILKNQQLRISPRALPLPDHTCGQRLYAFTVVYDVYRMFFQGQALTREQAFERGCVRGIVWVYPTAHKGKITDQARLHDDAYKDLIQYLRSAHVRTLEGRPGVMVITGEEFTDPAPAKTHWATWRQEWRCVPVK